MKQTVCYLYEYQGNKQVRNVGFVKCVMEETKATFHIHGKGISCPNQEQFEMYMFQSKESKSFISRAGNVEASQNKINYMVQVEGLTQEQLSSYDGLYLQHPSHKKYVAMWNAKEVNLDSVEPFIIETKHTQLISEEPTHHHDDIEMCINDTLHHEEEDAVIAEYHVEAEECCYDAVRENDHHIKHEDDNHQKETHCPGEEWDSHTELDCAYEEAEDHSNETCNCPLEEIHHREASNITYEKIKRQDIAKLPQREWKLANNNFLLHGYQNYHHILFIQEAGRSFIGVPGVYSSRESDAAQNFGFPVFHRVDTGDVSWLESEYEVDVDFGYWCKEVSSRNVR